MIAPVGELSRGRDDIMRGESRGAQRTNRKGRDEVVGCSKPWGAEAAAGVFGPVTAAAGRTGAAVTAAERGEIEGDAVNERDEPASLEATGVAGEEGGVACSQEEDEAVDASVSSVAAGEELYDTEGIVTDLHYNLAADNIQYEDFADVCRQGQFSRLRFMKTLVPFTSGTHISPS
ncbi:hypothetical protein HPB52_022391 [Rhipicephalus sanguineus]|uniref:Uncharacterized protein n=1 Tax=Rhipicephalus sanguineus TaxID=34632 RepID=A0A9D4T398_RHISA|nr:hypothetical protein HPB52_022391 [Rhipicephalus sanguineus]